MGCSTEKNTAINILYHSTTAKYNGYFNAKELIRIGLEDYRKTYREDYNRLIPVELLPNEEDVVDFYPIVDTAIKKCETVISKHSMPTASKPSKKKTEFANWVDMNWVLIGKAQYIRRDYQKALDNFEYIRKFYTDRSSTYIAQLWEAKCLIKLGEYSAAFRTIQKLEGRKNSFLQELGGQSRFMYKRRIRKMRRKQKEIDIPPAFPKELPFEMAKTKAELSIARKEYEEAIRHLKEALDLARKKSDKARLNFIVGQLLQEQENSNSRIYYTKSIKYNPPFEMGFKARINRALVGGKSEDEIILELRKMLGEEKYFEYKDQVYYAMASVELKRNDVPKAKYFLSKSVFYSINNNLQKGVSYEKLGNITFKERNYVHAQRYYDSSAQVIPDDYHNKEFIQNKAEQLSNLVENVDIISYEDSVQKIANMSESDREQFLEDVIEELKEQERIRKEKEARRAEKMRELQLKQAEASSGAGSKFYFNNIKAMDAGFEEFRTIWGQREDEDNWRRSNKPLTMDFDEEEEEEAADSIAKVIDPEDVPVDELTAEILMMNIPLTDSAMDVSNERLLASLYQSGMIYKEQLEELELGAKQFQRVVDKNIENEHNVLAAFQLYEINSERNPSKAQANRTYILNNYPNSDYANYLRDPDYFIKQKELDAIAQKEYLQSVDRFERGLYFPIIQKAKNVIENEPDNKYRPQYFILKAMAMGQINNDKTSLIPVLEQAIEEYPETQTAERAQEMLDLINNGVPTLEPLDFSAGSNIYSYSGKDKMYALIYLKSSDNKKEAQTKIADFNREFFSRSKLNTNSQIFSNNLTFIKVGEFDDEFKAEEYLRDFKKTKKHLRDLRSNKIIFISTGNYKILMKERKIEDYEKFFENYY